MNTSMTSQPVRPFIRLPFKEAVRRRERLLQAARTFYNQIDESSNPSAEQIDYIQTINRAVEDLESSIMASAEYRRLKESHRTIRGVSRQAHIGTCSYCRRVFPAHATQCQGCGAPRTA